MLLMCDTIKIEPKAVVKHYCVWFGFYINRRYLSLYGKIQKCFSSIVDWPIDKMQIQIDDK